MDFEEESVIKIIALYPEFTKYASRTGIELAGFVAAKMALYIENEKQYDEYQKAKREGLL